MTRDYCLPGNRVQETVEISQQPEACPICAGRQVSELLAAPDRFHGRKQMFHLIRCHSCDGVWLANPPKPEEMYRHYSEDYHKDIVAAGEGSASVRWKDQVKLVSQYKQEGALLDVGCSSGSFLGTMQGPRWKLYGVEVEKSTAERATARTGAQVYVGDAVDAPFSAASFDVITCFDVLEHLYSPRQFLTRALEWLKPGGIFYSMMPNIDSWEARVFGTHWYGLELPRHLFHFSPAPLRYLMTDLGFEEVQIKTPSIAYIERSIGYVCCSLLGKFGFSPTPKSKQSRTLIRRIVGKGLRLSLEAPFGYMASLAGAGPCMEVIFRKP